jgi:hypothetical protein
LCDDFRFLSSPFAAFTLGQGKSKMPGLTTYQARESYSICSYLGKFKGKTALTKAIYLYPREDSNRQVLAWGNNPSICSTLLQGKITHLRSF